MNKADISKFRRLVLAWYDKHHRILPWRAAIGQQADPYHVWLSEIMLQQTTVATVQAYFKKFIRLWPTIDDLAKAHDDDVLSNWAGLGYYARARNLIKCARIVVNDYNGQFPDNEKDLLQLPGIGRYTAAAIMSIAFQKPSIVVDGNIERIMARLYAVKTPLKQSKDVLYNYAVALAHNRKDRTGDYAQALMDIGATICTPQHPECFLCPLKTMCKAHALGIANDLPVKAEKAERPQRIGHVYIIENKKGELLLERRKEKGLLGGMLGFPTSEWITIKNPKDKDFVLISPLITPATDMNRHIKHIFTHFELRLNLWHGYWHSRHKNDIINSGEASYVWMHKSCLAEAGLPTVFKKVLRIYGG